MGILVSYQAAENKSPINTILDLGPLHNPFGRFVYVSVNPIELMDEVIKNLSSDPISESIWKRLRHRITSEMAFLESLEKED